MNDHLRRSQRHSRARIAGLLILFVALGISACDRGLPLGSSGDGDAAGQANPQADAGGIDGSGDDATAEVGSDEAEGAAADDPGASEEQSEVDAVAATPAGTPDPGDAALPPSGELDGIPVGFTEAGFPYRGDPDAPLVVEEYSDYHCPFCARFATQTKPTLFEDYVATGQVRFVFREFPIASLHPRAAQVHLSAACVAEQGAEPYWRLHDALFRQQTESTNAADLDDFLAEQVAELDIDQAEYSACLESGRPEQAVQSGVQAAAALGYNGTPSFRFVVAETGQTYDFSGAQPTEEFAAWFDALLAGEEPPIPPTPEPPELPFWADEGLAPDPDRPGVNLAGDPYEGSADAPLTVVEFTDYQCEPCGSFNLEAHPEVRAQLVDSGRIRWVIKHLPLPEHPQSAVAAAAAECATDQGAFWEMNTALFENLDRWAIEQPDAVLVEIAGTLGMDEQAFAGCLAGREAMQRVLTDQFEALGLTQSTPTFVVLDGETGSLLRGNRSAEEMIQLLESILAELDSGD